MEFEIGERVTAFDENVSGVVMQVDAGLVQVKVSYWTSLAGTSQKLHFGAAPQYFWYLPEELVRVH